MTTLAKRCARFDPVAMIVIVATVAVLVLPACAQARTTTKITIIPTQTTAIVAAPLAINGRLVTSAGVGIRGRVLRLEKRLAGAATWSLEGTRVTSVTGRVLLRVKPSATTYYRFVYDGETAYYPATSAQQRIVGHGYDFTFREEFDGTAVNTTTWSQNMQWGNVTANMLQLFTPSANSVSNGLLGITVNNRTTSSQYPQPYSSGAVSAYGSNQYHFTYGYVETRVKTIKGAALWPCVWLLPTSRTSYSEIDVAEALGQTPSTARTTIHVNKVGGGMTQVWRDYNGPDFSAGYHTFGIEWAADKIVWYIDGVERYRVTHDANGDHDTYVDDYGIRHTRNIWWAPPGGYIPHEDMYPLASVQVGNSDWAGHPDSTTAAAMPATFHVDYIRILRRQ